MSTRYLIEAQSRRGRDAQEALDVILRLDARGIEVIMSFCSNHGGVAYVWALILLEEGVNVIDVTRMISNEIGFETIYRYQIDALEVNEEKGKRRRL